MADSGMRMVVVGGQRVLRVQPRSFQIQKRAGQNQAAAVADVVFAAEIPRMTTSSQQSAAAILLHHQRAAHRQTPTTRTTTRTSQIPT